MRIRKPGNLNARCSYKNLKKYHKKIEKRKLKQFLNDYKIWRL